jgi:GAF domain-containing protein
MTLSKDAEDAIAPEQVAGRSDDLAVALGELSGLLLADEGLETTLRRIADLAVRTMPMCSAAGVTLGAAEGPETFACTDHLVLEDDRRQHAAGDGPCLDALRHRRINSVNRAEAEQRWPQFAAEAAEPGIRSFLAAPLIAGDEAIGSVNLYSTEDDGFEQLDDALVALFSGQASVAIANAKLYSSALALSQQLREALTSREVIEQAKGILMAQHRVDANAAFDLLRERSQHENRKLRDVAREIVASIC